jgi:hypothetical protein
MRGLKSWLKPCQKKWTSWKLTSSSCESQLPSKEQFEREFLPRDLRGRKFAVGRKAVRRSAGKLSEASQKFHFCNRPRDFVPLVRARRPVEVPRMHRLTFFCLSKMKTTLALILVRKPGIVVSDQIRVVFPKLCRRDRTSLSHWAGALADNGVSD